MDITTEKKRIAFKLLAPMMYIEDMEKYFGVKDIKKLPKIQQHMINRMREWNRTDAKFELKGTNKNQGEEFYVIQPDPKGMNLQFPARYFEWDVIDGQE
jgi:hypothetical protein